MKADLLGHITAVLVARGPDQFRHETRAYLEHVFLPAGIETAAEVLPEFLLDLQERLEQRYHQVRHEVVGEVFLVGWAPSKGRFAGWHLHYSQDYAAAELEVGMTHYAPGGPDYRPMPYIDFDAKLLRFARKQHEVMVAETPPGECPRVGGDLIAVDLSRAGCVVRKIARLPGYDDLVEWIMRGEAS